MSVLVLKKQVIVRGPNLYGYPSEALLRPAGKPGWYWQPSREVEPLPISPQLFRHNRRRTTLYQEINGLTSNPIDGTKPYPKIYRAEVCEDYLLGRWLVDEVVLVTHVPWLPYYGRAYEILERLKNLSCPENKEREWLTINAREPIKIRYPNLRNGHEAFTQIESHNKPELLIKIFCDYPGVPAISQKPFTFKIPNLALIEWTKVYTQGWPHWWYYPSQGASWLSHHLLSRLPKRIHDLTGDGWIHHHHITWPRQIVKNSLLYRYVRHRLCDLLGVLAGVHYSALLAAKVESHYSGHWADVQAVKKAGQILCPL